jgi:hypothetical protein
MRRLWYAPMTILVIIFLICGALWVVLNLFALLFECVTNKLNDAGRWCEGQI